MVNSRVICLLYNKSCVWKYLYRILITIPSFILIYCSIAENNNKYTAVIFCNLDSIISKCRTVHIKITILHVLLKRQKPIMCVYKFNIIWKMNTGPYLNCVSFFLLKQWLKGPYDAFVYIAYLYAYIVLTGVNVKLSDKDQTWTACTWRKNNYNWNMQSQRHNLITLLHTKVISINPSIEKENCFNEISNLLKPCY